jgi:endogenous inhibitor of DNA gyrase (YacG/DUF329 family)
MPSSRRKVAARERARQRRIAVSERRELETPESTLLANTCPRCGDEVARNASGRGRPRVWCSQRCRRAAYEERRAAANGAISSEVVVRRTEPSWDETIARVLASPVASRKVVRELSRRLRDHELSQPQWDGVLAEMLSLGEAARFLYRHDAAAGQAYMGDGQE